LCFYSFGIFQNAEGSFLIGGEGEELNLNFEGIASGGPGVLTVTAPPSRSDRSAGQTPSKKHSRQRNANVEYLDGGGNIGGGEGEVLEEGSGFNDNNITNSRASSKAGSRGLNRSRGTNRASKQFKKNDNDENTLDSFLWGESAASNDFASLPPPSLTGSGILSAPHSTSASDFGFVPAPHGDASSVGLLKGSLSKTIDSLKVSSERASDEANGRAKRGGSVRCAPRVYAVLLLLVASLLVAPLTAFSTNVASLLAALRPFN